MDKKDINAQIFFLRHSIYYNYFRMINFLRVLKFNSTQRLLKHYYHVFIPKPIKKFLKYTKMKSYGLQILL